MTDIIVTTPKKEMKNAAKEANDCKREGGGQYFRRLSTVPKYLRVGDRIWYVEDGFIRGYAIVERIEIDSIEVICATTGKEYSPGCYVYMQANSWTWIKPIPHRGFQNYRYVSHSEADGFTVVGGWLDPKPDTKSLVAS